MDCLRSCFSCCCSITEDPIAKYKAAQESNLSAIETLLPQELLATIVSYDDGRSITYNYLSTPCPVASPFQLALISRITRLTMDQIPEADACVRLAERLPRVTELILTGGTQANSLPRLKPLQSLRFVWITDGYFLLPEISKLAQFPNLIGIDVTPRDIPTDVANVDEAQLQLMQLEQNDYMSDEVVDLFTALPSLTYVHIRNGVHVCHAALNALPKDILAEGCQKYLKGALPNPTTPYERLVPLPESIANGSMTEITYVDEIPAAQL